jgi:hypothetical protein
MMHFTIRIKFSLTGFVYHKKGVSFMYCVEELFKFKYLHFEIPAIYFRIYSFQFMLS